jgi:hypothetical protein
LIARRAALIFGPPAKEVRMKKLILASVAVLVVAGSTAVYAQSRPWWFNHGIFRINPEDRAAFADARIAAVHAGLKLTPDQDKLWPPVEAAVKDFSKLRIDRANARMKAWRDDDSDAQKTTDPVTKLRERADTMATTAAALKKIADAADPLYKTLDDGQKRRLAVLTHADGHDGWRGHGFRHRDDRDDDGPRGDRGPGRGMLHGPGALDDGPGPDRL